MPTFDELLADLKAKAMPGSLTEKILSRQLGGRGDVLYLMMRELKSRGLWKRNGYANEKSEVPAQEHEPAEAAGA